MAPAFSIHVIIQMNSRQAGIRKGRKPMNSLEYCCTFFIDTIKIKWRGRDMRKEALQLA